MVTPANSRTTAFSFCKPPTSTGSAPFLSSAVLSESASVYLLIMSWTNLCSRHSHHYPQGCPVTGISKSTKHSQSTSLSPSIALPNTAEFSGVGGQRRRNHPQRAHASRILTAQRRTLHRGRTCASWREVPCWAGVCRSLFMERKSGGSEETDDAVG